MLVHVKTPHIEIDIKGKKYDSLIELLKKDFGDAVEIYDDNFVDITDTDWFNETEVSPGEVVKIFRKNKKMTQEDLGIKIGGKSKQFVSDIENGRRGISKKVALALAAFFETDYKRFL